MNIDIKELENIKEKLEGLDEDDALFVDENGSTKYVILPINKFDNLEEIFKEDQGSIMPAIKIINGDGFELSYDEYETVKKQLNEIFEKTFKPKPEKLN